MATVNNTHSTESADSETSDDVVAVENPYNLPPRMMFSGRYLYGARVHIPFADDPVAQVKSVRALSVREDDVFILAYPKCGTHWMWEVVHMLLHQRTQYENRTKEFGMLEFNPMPSVDAQSSPRILNSHNWMCHLPRELMEKKAKIIHLVRNPKDAVVSAYHHVKQHEESLSFDTFVKATMFTDCLALESQFEYLRQFSVFEKEHPDHPIKHVHYEDMKKNAVKTTKEIAEFLQVASSDVLCEDVAAACSFDKMKEMDEGRKMPEHLMAELEKKNVPSIKMYRKGMVGDWKNHFTVAQNEAFDAFIARETAKGLNFTFTYE